MKTEPFESTLRDGTRVLIRPLVPADRQLLEAGFAHLSDKSRYLRFHGHKNKLSDHDLDFLANIDGDDHFAIGAVDIDVSPSEPVGVARYVRLPDRQNAAEIAVTIIDSHQGIGLGSALVAALALHAEHDDIESFVALVHEENAPMLHLFEKFGAQVESRQDGEVSLVIPLHCDESHP